MDVEAYPTGQATPLEIVPAVRGRGWHRFIPPAGACLPLTIANEAGWWLLNPEPFEVIDVGGEFEVAWPDIVPEKPHVANHFGHNVLTVAVPYLFRTPPGWQLQIRGPANYFYDGMQPFEGIVETDWNDATATMNWLVRSGAEFVVEAGEPLCQIVPVRLDALEAFTVVETPMPSETEAGYQEFVERRTESLSKHPYKFEHGYRQRAERRRVNLE